MFYMDYFETYFTLNYLHTPAHKLMSQIKKIHFWEFIKSNFSFSLGQNF